MESWQGQNGQPPLLLSLFWSPLANANCQQPCEARGGECMESWQGQNGYLGLCREGRWPNLCYCGYCYKSCTKTAWFDRDNPGGAGDWEIFGNGIQFPPFSGCNY